MVIMRGQRRWSRLAPEIWFNHDLGASFVHVNEIWFPNRVVLFYNDYALVTLTEDQYWDLHGKNKGNQGYT